MKRMKPHWHALSEKYTGADSLLAALQAGWTLNRLIGSEDFRHWGGPITIYYFELGRQGETVNMAVVSNPYVIRLVAEMFAQDKTPSVEAARA